MKINTIDTTNFGKIEFSDETQKEIFLNNASIPIGYNDPDIFIRKYEEVDAIKDVKLEVGNQTKPNLKIYWRDILDPLFKSYGDLSDKSTFERFNEALNYIILKKKLVVDKWN